MSAYYCGEEKVEAAMGTRVTVQPALLAWALARCRKPATDLPEQFKNYPKWLSGEISPTFKQLEKFAEYTHTPLGLFFLDEPPREIVPIPDFRTQQNKPLGQPSVDLLDTIYGCQNRQEWYREYAFVQGFEPLALVGSLSIRTPVTIAAGAIQEALKWGVQERNRCRTREDVRRYLIAAIEDMGILVMVNGIVGNNTHRPLNPMEFRGLSLADDMAPLIFVNAADSMSAQIFTLVHELAHIWCGDSALSDADLSMREGQDKEIWANKVAAEVLVPGEELKLRASVGGLFDSASLSELYKVSELVILSSAFDAGLLDWEEYQQLYSDSQTRNAQFAKREPTKGGNYYNTQPYRISRRFARAVITDTREGRTLYRDAYALLGMTNHQTFENLAERVMV